MCAARRADVLRNKERGGCRRPWGKPRVLELLLLELLLLLGGVHGLHELLVLDLLGPQARRGDGRLGTGAARGLRRGGDERPAELVQSSHHTVVGFEYICNRIYKQQCAEMMEQQMMRCAAYVLAAGGVRRGSHGRRQSPPNSRICRGGEGNGPRVAGGIVRPRWGGVGFFGKQD